MHTAVTGTTSIPEDVLEVIKQGEWKDGGFIMPQMDRKLYTKVAKTLKALGGTWNRSAQATLFDEDGESAIRQACETGEYVDYKKLYQFFETPPEVAGMVAANADLTVGLSVLEPSVGDGALLFGLQDYYDIELKLQNSVTAVELDASRFDPPEDHAAYPLMDRLHNGVDFLSLMPAELGTFDRIIMNPPFTKCQDIQHVRHAYDFLAPDGRLVAVMPPGWTFRSDKRTTAFREWVHGLDYEWELLPDNSFKSAGTGVATGILVINKSE